MSTPPKKDLPEYDIVPTMYGDKLEYLDRKIEKIIYTLDSRIIKIDESLNNLRVEVAKLASVSTRLDKIEDSVDASSQQVAKNVIAMAELGRRLDKIDNYIEQGISLRMTFTREVESINTTLVEVSRRLTEQDKGIDDLKDKIGWIERVMWQGIGGLGAVLLVKTAFDFLTSYGHYFK